MPDVVYKMCTSFFDCDTHESEHLQIKYLKFINALFSDVNPIPIKYAINKMEIGVWSFRLLLCEKDDDKKQILNSILKEYNLFK